MAELHQKDLSYQVVGCAMRVHAALGPGFPESVYHRALTRELMDNKIPFHSEKVAEVYYKDTLCGDFRMDIVVADSIVLELKALDVIASVHTAQALSYLKATGLRLAIVVNFGAESLETKRVVL